MSHYVYSTAPADFAFTPYSKSPDGSSLIPGKPVLIKGGAQLPDKTAHHIYTPSGMVTVITDSEAEYLKTDLAFKQLVELGYMRIESKRIDVDAAVGKMELPTKQEGAPITETDIEQIETMDDDVEVRINDKKAKKR